jgi:hypothetical protein
MALRVVYICSVVPLKLASGGAKAPQIKQKGVPSTISSVNLPSVSPKSTSSPYSLPVHQYRKGTIPIVGKPLPQVDYFNAKSPLLVSKHHRFYTGSRLDRLKEWMYTTAQNVKQKASSVVRKKQSSAYDPSGFQ